MMPLAKGSGLESNGQIWAISAAAAAQRPPTQNHRFNIITITKVRVRECGLYWGPSAPKPAHQFPQDRSTL